MVSSDENNEWVVGDMALGVVATLDAGIGDRRRGARIFSIGRTLIYRGETSRT